MSKLEELMSSPITINIDCTLADVTKTMLDKKISRVLVIKNEQITSIVTEKDLGLFLLGDKSGRSLQQIPLSELAKPILSVSQSMIIQECAKIMLENNVGSLAITSENESIVGIITKTDLVRYVIKNDHKKKKVGECMTEYYSWVYSDDLLGKVVAKMLEQKISRVIVRNEEQVPVGIISFRDLFELIRNMASKRDIIFPKNFESEHGIGKTLHADEVMRNEIITVSYKDDLTSACQVLLDNKINGVGVLSDKGGIIGVLSKTDIIKSIATPN
jgi:CBS domain-containing protein